VPSLLIVENLNQINIKSADIFQKIEIRNNIFSLVATQLYSNGHFILLLRDNKIIDNLMTDIEILDIDYIDKSYKKTVFFYERIQ
jgi:hypothetical protein